jgi:hypothetical protein
MVRTSGTSPVSLIIWSVRFIWLVYCNQTNQTDRTDQMNKTGGCAMICIGAPQNVNRETKDVKRERRDGKNESFPTRAAHTKREGQRA